MLLGLGILTIIASQELFAGLRVQFHTLSAQIQDILLNSLATTDQQFSAAKQKCSSNK